MVWENNFIKFSNKMLVNLNLTDLINHGNISSVEILTHRYILEAILKELNIELNVNGKPTDFRSVIELINDHLKQPK